MARPAVSDLQVTVLGLISFQADLLPITESPAKAQSFRLVCPECDVPTPSIQGYTCPSGHGPHSSGEMLRAQEVDKELHFVTAEEIAEVKTTDLPPKVANFDLYPTRDVLAATYPTGVTYRVRTDQVIDSIKVIVSMVREGTYSFVGEVNLGARSGQKVFKLSEWQGNLLFEELARPEQVIPVEPADLNVNPALVEKANMLAATQVEDFDAAKFTSRTRERALALADSKRGQDSTVAASAPTATKVDSAADLMSLLEQALGGDK
jgi:hypothetical protein